MVLPEVQAQSSAVAQTARLSAASAEADIHPQGRREEDAASWNPMHDRPGTAGAVSARSGAGRGDYGRHKLLWFQVGPINGRRNRTMLPGVERSRFCTVDS